MPKSVPLNIILLFAGLDNQIHGTGMDRHGYIEVIADPVYDGQPQVCLPCSKPYHWG